ncbi:MAG TPA: glycosyltransferase family 4 protein [Candidatus Sulfotelmatobacter sp.]|nr:glycosyltransferase family 4 protein [Candidatus Sulfotelmatobacter sp.]
MRVVHVAPTLFGTRGLYGGGERFPFELARALAPHVDCSVVTFSPKPSGSRVSSEVWGVPTKTLTARWYARAHPAHPITPALPLALTHADVIHTHHLKSAPSRIAALTARALGRKAVVTDHGLAGGDWLGMLPRLFHRFLAVSEYSARQLRSPAARTRVIFAGTDPDRFRPDADERRDGVLFVGRLTPHKGVDRLIEALPKGVRLTIAGSEGHDPRPPESGYPGLLRRLAAGRDVVFTGAVGESDLPLLYRRALVAVLPSVHHTCYGRSVAVSELLGLSILEAMSSGTPVVCSRIGGVPEIVEDGVTGFLVEPGDVAALRDRLGVLVSDRGLATRMGESARESVLERFTWKACAQRCLDVYQELVTPSRQ